MSRVANGPRQRDFSPARVVVGPRGEAAAPQSVSTVHRGTIPDSGSSLRQGDVSGDAAGTPPLRAETPSSQFQVITGELPFFPGTTRSITATSHATSSVCPFSCRYVKSRTDQFSHGERTGERTCIRHLCPPNVSRDPAAVKTPAVG